MNESIWYCPKFNKLVLFDFIGYFGVKRKGRLKYEDNDVYGKITLKTEIIPWDWLREKYVFISYLDPNK